MDYMDFLEEFDTYNEMNILNKKTTSPKFSKEYPPFKSNVRALPQQKDMVNHPAHYTKGKIEVIDVIEDAIKDAPSAIYGMLQAQSLKYILRMWNKEDSAQDAQKAIWYLERLIEKIKERDDA